MKVPIQMKQVLILFFALTLAVGAEAQNKLSNRTIRYMHHRQGTMQRSVRAAGQQEEMVPCLLRVTAPCTEQLQALGVKTQLELGDIMTADIYIVNGRKFIVR